MGNKVCILPCVPIKTKKSKTIKHNLPSPLSPQPTLTLDNFFETNEISIPSPLPIEGVPFYDCEICYASKPLNDSFNIEGCTHFFCTKCTIKYIVSNLQQNKVNLNCPEQGCSGTLNPQYCKPILPTNLMDRWEKALSESVIPVKNKFYCPFYECSTLLISEENRVRGVIIKSLYSTCPHCNRRVCVKCKTPWHEGMSCEKFQRWKNKKSNNDALMVELASRRKWKKCPNCKSFVEKIQGCDHIKCRCSYQFCYRCGRGLKPFSHHGCNQRD